MICLKIIQNTLQIIFTIDQQVGFTDPWPEPFRTLVGLYGYISFYLQAYVPNGCVGPRQSIFQSILIQTLVPIGLVVLLRLLSFVPKLSRLSPTRAKYWQILVMNICLPSTTVALISYFITINFADGSSFLSADLAVEVVLSTGETSRRW